MTIALLFGWSGETWTIITIITIALVLGVLVVTDDTDWFD